MGEPTSSMAVSMRTRHSRRRDKSERSPPTHRSSSTHNYGQARRGGVSDASGAVRPVLRNAGTPPRRQLVRSLSVIEEPARPDDCAETARPRGHADPGSPGSPADPGSPGSPAALACLDSHAGTG